MELESDTYDVVVIGTGLAQSIAAAALAKSGKSVLHLDPNDYYGDQQASLTLDELQQWCQSNSDPIRLGEKGSYEHGSASSSKLDESLTKNRRRYALSLFPAILPSRGPLIQTLINSGVSKYVSFRMLDSVSVWQNSTDRDGDGGEGEGIRRVPGSKEQVFKDKEISLMEKRRLMKFLMFSAGEFENDILLKGKGKEPFPTFLEDSFSLPTNLASQVAYAIAHCSSPTDPTLDALKRTRRYIKSIGRYGSGAFLVGQYGGAGEIAQGFCRACAVFGGTYVLGQESIPESIDVSDDSVTLKIPCHPRTITAKHLITSPDHLPLNLRPDSNSEGNTTAHCIALLPSLPDSLRRPKTEPIDGEEEGEDDTAVIVFPPAAGRGLVRAVVMGEGTGSCPAGQFVLYLSTSSDSDPRDALKSFLSRLSPEPIFESYYTSRRSPTPSPSAQAGKGPVIVLDPYSDLEILTEGLDWEAEQGEKAFWKVMGEGVENGIGFFDKIEEEGMEEDDL